MSSSVVQRWIEWSKATLRDETSAIPLIDTSPELGRDLDSFLNGCWCDDGELHAGFVDALLENPTDAAVRFAALNAYYHLMEHKRPLEEEDLGGLAKRREAFRRKLAYFVGFLPVESCADLRSIRWEIVNSCAAEDYDRAFRLCDQLQPLLPNWNVSFARGRLHFLAVHLPLWDDPPSLNSWDLPVGPPPADGCDDVLRKLAVGATVRRCLGSPELEEGIPDDAKAHLRRSIAELETAFDGNRNPPLECDLMLARCYAAIGQNHEAARRYKGVLKRREDLLRYFREPCEFLSQEQLRELGSELFHRLVTAHQRAEETNEAIQAAQEWIDEFPTARNAYPIMARLHEEKFDLAAACAWYRRGVDRRIPELENDWKISLILKLGETGSVEISDRRLTEYLADHSLEIQLVNFALRRHWPAFKHLDQTSRDRWCAGVHHLSTKPYAQVSNGVAVHMLAGVVERVLRESVFVPFREVCRRNPRLLGDITRPAERSQHFLEFLSGRSELAIGQMLKIARIAVGSSQTPFGPFAGWLKNNRRSYFKRIGQLGEEKIGALRNDEDHAKLRLITDSDADWMLDAARTMISVIHEDSA